jgi:hypothetical protein
MLPFLHRVLYGTTPVIPVQPIAPIVAPPVEIPIELPIPHLERFDRDFLRDLFEGPGVQIRGFQGNVMMHRKCSLPNVMYGMNLIREKYAEPEILEKLLEIDWGSLPGTVTFDRFTKALVKDGCIFLRRERPRLVSGLKALGYVSRARKNTGLLYYPDLYNFIILFNLFKELNQPFPARAFSQTPGAVAVNAQFIQALRNQYDGI